MISVANTARGPLQVWLGRHVWSPLGWPPVLVEIVRLAACIAVAAAYYGIERYFLRRKDRLQA